MNVKTIAIVLATALAMPAMAHHSFAMFDMQKTLVLNGTVKEFQWVAPHSWIQLMVPGSDGNEVEWSIEWRAPNHLTRNGLRRDAFKPGEKAQITVNPMRNGAPGGSLSKAVFPDGKTYDFNGPQKPQ